MTVKPIIREIGSGWNVTNPVTDPPTIKIFNGDKLIVDSSKDCSIPNRMDFNDEHSLIYTFKSFDKYSQLLVSYDNSSNNPTSVVLVSNSDGGGPK